MHLLDPLGLDQDHIYFIRIEDGFIVYDSALDFKAPCWATASRDISCCC